MNAGDLGLTAGVYSEDEAFAKAVLSKVDAGTVYWNRHGEVQPWMPWSGRKSSGLGVFLSIQGIRECFTRTKAWFT